MCSAGSVSEKRRGAVDERVVKRYLRLFIRPDRDTAQEPEHAKTDD